MCSPSRSPFRQAAAADDDAGGEVRSSMSVTPLVSIVTPSYNTGRFIGARGPERARPGLPARRIRRDGRRLDRQHGRRAQVASAPALQLGVASATAARATRSTRASRRRRATILGWLNSDDTYAPGAVRAAAEFLGRNPTSTWSTATRLHRRRGQRHRPLRPRRAVRPPTGCSTTPTSSCSRRCSSAAAPSRRSAGIDASLHWAMDYDLWLKIAAAGLKVAYLPRVLANFRWLGGQQDRDRRLGPARRDRHRRRAATAPGAARVHPPRARATCTCPRRWQAWRHRDVGEAAAGSRRPRGTSFVVPARRCGACCRRAPGGSCTSARCCAAGRPSARRLWCKRCRDLERQNAGCQPHRMATLPSHLSMIRAILFDILAPILILVALGA